jgi:hypothetical protein
MNRIDAWRMIQRRAADLGFKVKIGPSAQPESPLIWKPAGTLENAQAMAAHESPRTTKLHDRSGDEITLDEVERIAIWKVRYQGSDDTSRNHCTVGHYHRG